MKRFGAMFGFVVLSLSLLMGARAEIESVGVKPQVFPNLEPAPTHPKFPLSTYLESVSVERKRADTYLFKITLRGEIEKRFKWGCLYQISFDFDQDGQAKAGSSRSSLGYGTDYSVLIIRPEDEFFARASQLIMEGKYIEAEYKNVRGKDKTISVEISSNVFKKYPSFNFYVTSSAGQKGYEFENAETVDMIKSAKGYLTYEAPPEKKNE